MCWNDLTASDTAVRRCSSALTLRVLDGSGAIEHVEEDIFIHAGIPKTSIYDKKKRGGRRFSFYFTVAASCGRRKARHDTGKLR